MTDGSAKHAKKKQRNYDFMHVASSYSCRECRERNAKMRERISGMFGYGRIYSILDRIISVEDSWTSWKDAQRHMRRKHDIETARLPFEGLYDNDIPLNT